MNSMNVKYVLGIFTSLIYSVLTGTTTDITSTGVATSTATNTIENGGGNSGGNGGGGNPPAPESTTSSENVYENFFDDPHNQATYIVLPVMILVYGGCAMIYCIAKCRRNCKKRARKRNREMLIREGLVPDPDRNCFDNPTFSENIGSMNETKKLNNASIEDVDEEPGTKAAKPIIQRGAGKMGYNIMPLPNSTEDPVINSNIDVHLKNAFAMIENAARDIKMQQALDLKSCPDRYPADEENQHPISKKGGFKQKVYIAV